MEEEEEVVVAEVEWSRRGNKKRKGFVGQELKEGVAVMTVALFSILPFDEEESTPSLPL
jgi:hypothetical protein